jgi:hypothetical protein
MRAKLHAIKKELRRKMHEPVADVGAWLKRVVDGYYRYHAVPGNLAVLGRFRERVCRYCGTFYVVAVSGGSPIGNNCGRSSIDGFLALVLFIPIPISDSTLVSQRGAVCGNSASTDLCGG